MLRIGTIYYSQNCHAYLPVTPTLRSRRLMACEIDGLLCQTQVIVANCTTEDYTCLKYFWHLSNEILYRDLVCFVKRQTSNILILTKMTSDNHTMIFYWLIYDRVENHSHCTLKRTSLLCLMQVNVNKQLTTNILTHMITLN